MGAALQGKITKASYFGLELKMKYFGQNLKLLYPPYAKQLHRGFQFQNKTNEI